MLKPDKPGFTARGNTLLLSERRHSYNSLKAGMHWAPQRVALPQLH